MNPELTAQAIAVWISAGVVVAVLAVAQYVNWRN